MNAKSKTKTLLGLLLFNGLSAAVGGLALMTDWIPEQASWVRDTDFPSNYFPGVILMAVVGGSSLIAAAALVKRSDGWQLASIVAGTIMVFWIIGEVASIRGFHFLQRPHFFRTRFQLGLHFRPRKTLVAVHVVAETGSQRFE